MLVRNVKKRNPPWLWRVLKSIYDLRQNHWKTLCFRDLPPPRSTARLIFIRKRTGCREWCWFVYYFMGSFSMTLCSNAGHNFEKPWENRVFSWLACTTLDSQSDFHRKMAWLSRVVLLWILLCGLTFQAQIVKLQGRCCKVVAFLCLLCFNELYENQQMMRSYHK